MNELLRAEVAFWESQLPYRPLNWKAEKIAEGAKVSTEVAMKALVEYQHEQEI